MEYNRGYFHRESNKIPLNGGGEDVKENSGNFAPIYHELADLVGVEAAKKIWKNYAGLTVDFPRRLYSREYNTRFIRQHKNDMKPREIAQELDLSERRVRQVLHEIQQEESEEEK